MNKKILCCLLILLVVCTASCQAQPKTQINFDSDTLHFSGETAFEFEENFVKSFPNRHSGETNSQLAAEYLLSEGQALGLACRLDKWTVINYSQPLKLVNTICELQGNSSNEIVIAAHHDIASTTIEGADNDGAGVAILHQLASVLTQETKQPYTIVFLFSDGEEYGMLGTRRYVDTHPNIENILAAISLDNVGRPYYDGMMIELIGQYKNYGPVWLPLAARDAAEAAGLWKVYMRAPFDQVTDQAAPMSLMDQGPFIAAGIPAVGLAGRVPAEFQDFHYGLWHDPEDNMSNQAASTLGLSGKTVEALIRQLQTMNEFPRANQPYLYFEESNTILTGAPLWLIFIAFVSIFFIGSWFAGKKSIREKVAGWPGAVQHFLGIWIPLLLSVVLMYGMVWAGLMDSYDTYPATAKDPAMLNPRWPAVIIFCAGLALFIYIGRRIIRRYEGTVNVESTQIKSLALFIIGLCGVYLLIRNPFSLLFIVPGLFWLMISGRSKAGKALDILFFLLGGLVVYALVFIFGFVVLRYNLTFLWFMMNMFSIRLISFKTAALITAIIAAALTLVVNPPRRRMDKLASGDEYSSSVTT